jgi:hypothetical protein
MTAQLIPLPECRSAEFLGRLVPSFEIQWNVKFLSYKMFTEQHIDELFRMVLTSENYSEGLKIEMKPNHVD